jgi:hypothetical protein
MTLRSRPVAEERYSTYQPGTQCNTYVAYETNRVAVLRVIEKRQIPTARRTARPGCHTGISARHAQ